MKNSPMTVKQALKVLKETGEYPNYHVSRDSYEQRCKLYDAAKELEADASSKMPSKEAIFNRAMKIHNTTKGKGFIEGAEWVISLAKPSKKQ